MSADRAHPDPAGGEAAASDPAASDPAASEAAASDPAASDPAASDPAASDPAATDPAATDPACADPMATPDPPAVDSGRLQPGESQSPAGSAVRGANPAQVRADPAARPGPVRERGYLFRQFHVNATAFLHEILWVADSLEEARAFDGEPALHLGTRWRLLRAIERCGGAPTFSDIGRLLGISRQAAREQALATASAGLVELFQCPDDRRVWQVALTPAGCRALDGRRMPPFDWLFTLLNGLEPEVMRSTQHVLHVIRLRLERYEKERRRAASAAGRWRP